MPHLEGELAVPNRSPAEHDRSRMLDGVSSTVPADRQKTVIVSGASGKGELAQLHVGSGGSRLPLAERQRVGLARALLKHPELLILNEATAALEREAQATVISRLKANVYRRRGDLPLHRASLASNFDPVLVLSNGKLLKQGASAKIAARKDWLMTFGRGDRMTKSGLAKPKPRREVT